MPSKQGVKRPKSRSERNVAIYECLVAINKLRAAMIELSGRIHENCKIISHFVILQQVLINKGIITEQDLSDEHEKLRDETIKEREASNDNDDSGNPEGSGLQSEATGNNEDNSGDG